jgi:hypothetical protein
MRTSPRTYQALLPQRLADDAGDRKLDVRVRASEHNEQLPRLQPVRTVEFD